MSPAPYYRGGEVMFTDAEFLVARDLLEVQSFHRFLSLDMLTGGRARLTEGDAAYTAGYVYSYGGGAPRTSATAKQVKNDTGMILLPSGATADGSAPTLIPYYLDADELVSTLDVGDASPRWDLISVKLDIVEDDTANDAEIRFTEATDGVFTSSPAPGVVKRRKAVLTKTVTKGTAAAGSRYGATPVVPATPAGYTPWAAVYMPALHNAAIDVENIVDYRMPIGLQQHRSWTFKHGPGVAIANGWAGAFGDNEAIVSQAGADVVRVFPASPAVHGGRLVSVTIMGELSGCTIELIRRHHSSGGAITETVLKDVSASFTGGADQVYTHTFGASFPVWCNGFQAGIAALKDPGAIGVGSGDARMTSVALKITSGALNKVLRFVNWNIAGGG